MMIKTGVSHTPYINLYAVAYVQFDPKGGTAAGRPAEWRVKMRDGAEFYFTHEEIPRLLVALEAAGDATHRQAQTAWDDDGGI